MSTIFALASVVLKELYRRKDFYVLFVITVAITLLMASVRFFDDAKIAGYLKDICLLLIWISAFVIAITTAARQIPVERENRTIFPLLAKPVTRAQIVVGKFAGCWFAVGMALLIFYVFFGVISASREGTWPLALYFQALWLQWMMLAVVIALVLFGSVVFSAPSANTTICFFVVLGIFVLGGHLNELAMRQGGVPGAITYIIYYLIPHLEWFGYMRDRINYNWGAVSWLDCFLATLYAGSYTAIFLFGTWLVFRRKPLTA